MMIEWLKNNTFFKFLSVGVINTIVGTLVMFGAYNVLHWNYWVSTALNYIIGGTISFFLNKRYTFHYAGNQLYAIIKFVVNIAVCYFVAYGVAKPVVFRLLSTCSNKIQENGAMVLGMGIYVLLNYFGQRYFAFNDIHKKKQEETNN